MNGKWLSTVALMVAGVLLLSLASCARSSKLVGIQIQPATETFGASDIPLINNKGASVQLRALGSYIHPPVTKDITDQVTWTSNTPDMVAVDSTGMITATGLACGGTLISATVQTNSSAGDRSSSGAIVTATMQANVTCFTGTGSGGSGPLLTVDFAVGAGTGSVVSTPSGIDCTTTCTASFASGSVVNITATPDSGSTFGGWSGCDSMTGQTCIINGLAANRTVTVTFN